MKSGEEMFRIFGVMVRLVLISNLLRVESFLEIQAVRTIRLLFIRLVSLISSVPFFSLSGNAKGDGKKAARSCKPVIPEYIEGIGVPVIL